MPSLQWRVRCSESAGSDTRHSVMTGKSKEAASSAKLLAAATERPMEILETEQQNETVPAGGGGTKAK
jgi:hypothetical protein